MTEAILQLYKAMKKLKMDSVDVKIFIQPSSSPDIPFMVCCSKNGISIGANFDYSEFELEQMGNIDYDLVGERLLNILKEMTD